MTTTNNSGVDALILKMLGHEPDSLGHGKYDGCKKYALPRYKKALYNLLAGETNRYFDEHNSKLIDAVPLETIKHLMGVKNE